MADTQDIPSDIFLNALIYRSDGEDGWAALALEMDIRGYGGTPAEAFQELGDLVRMQISFAMFKADPTLIWKAADPVWFERFADARRNQLRHQLLDISPTITFGLPRRLRFGGSVAIRVGMPVHREDEIPAISSEWVPRGDSQIRSRARGLSC